MILGLRCSNKDFAYAIMEGTRAKPTLLAEDLIAFPKGFSRVQSVTWFSHELDAIMDRHPCSKIVIKAFEGRARNNTFVERVEHETVAYFAAARKGIKSVVRKMKSTTAKDFGLKGRGRYLATLDKSPIPDFDSKNEKVQEAILAAWSSLG